MTAAPSAPHTAAVLARLQATMPAQVTVYDGRITDEPPPQTYVVVYPGGPIRTRTSMAVDAGEVTSMPQLTCVGISRAQAEAVADAVANALIGWRPVIAARSCDPVTSEVGRPAIRDETQMDPTTDQPRWFAIEIVRVHSVAA